MNLTVIYIIGFFLFIPFTVYMMKRQDKWDELPTPLAVILAIVNGVCWPIPAGNMLLVFIGGMISLVYFKVTDTQ